MNQHHRAAGLEPGANVQVGVGPGEGERPAGGGIGQCGEGGGSGVGQVLDEERSGEQRGPSGAGDRRGDDESEDEGGEPGYFRLMHFTRRHPLNMFTWVIDSGTSPTCSSNGAMTRFDFQPSRVHTGASRSSAQPVIRRWLRK